MQYRGGIVCGLIDYCPLRQSAQGISRVPSAFDFHRTLREQAQPPACRELFCSLLDMACSFRICYSLWSAIIASCMCCSSVGFCLVDSGSPVVASCSVGLWLPSYGTRAFMVRDDKALPYFCSPSEGFERQGPQLYLGVVYLPAY